MKNKFILMFSVLAFSFATSAMAGSDIESTESRGVVCSDSQNPNCNYLIRVSPLDVNGAITTYENAKSISYKLCEIAKPDSCVQDLGTYEKSYVDSLIANSNAKSQSAFSQFLRGAKTGGKSGAKVGGATAAAGLAGAVFVTITTGGFDLVIGGIAAGGAILVGTIAGGAFGGVHQAHNGKTEDAQFESAVQAKDEYVSGDIILYAKELKNFLQTGHVPTNGFLDGLKAGHISPTDFSPLGY